MYKDFYIGNVQYNWSKVGMIILDRNVLEIKMVDKIFFYCFIMVLEIELIIIYM